MNIKYIDPQRIKNFPLPVVSIQTNGCISFNHAATEQFNLKDYEGVMFGYDKDEKKYIFIKLKKLTPESLYFKPAINYDGVNVFSNHIAKIIATEYKQVTHQYLITEKKVNNKTYYYLDFHKTVKRKRRIPL